MENTAVETGYAQHFAKAALGDRDAKLALIEAHQAAIDSGQSGVADNLPLMIMWARLTVPHGQTEDAERLVEYLLFWLGWCETGGDRKASTKAAGEALNLIDHLADHGVDWADRDMPQFAEWLWPEAVEAAVRFRAIDKSAPL